jgi:hypothetical protein
MSDTPGRISYRGVTLKAARSRFVAIVVDCRFARTWPSIKAEQVPHSTSDHR